MKKQIFVLIFIAMLFSPCQAAGNRQMEEQQLQALNQRRSALEAQRMQIATQLLTAVGGAAAELRQNLANLDDALQEMEHAKIGLMGTILAMSLGAEQLALIATNIGFHVSRAAFWASAALTPMIWYCSSDDGAYLSPNQWLALGCGATAVCGLEYMQLKAAKFLMNGNLAKDKALLASNIYDRFKAMKAFESRLAESTESDDVKADLRARAQERLSLDENGKNLLGCVDKDLAKLLQD